MLELMVDVDRPEMTVKSGSDLRFASLGRSVLRAEQGRRNGSPARLPFERCASFLQGRDVPLLSIVRTEVRDVAACLEVVDAQWKGPVCFYAYSARWEGPEGVFDETLRAGFSVQ